MTMMKDYLKVRKGGETKYEVRYANFNHNTKGQITIPKDIRDILNVGKGDRVEFLVNTNGSVTILPVTSDITALKGLVQKPQKHVSLDDMKNAIRDMVADFDRNRHQYTCSLHHTRR